MQELKLFLISAPQDIPRADEVKTLIKDIWDLRIAKLRSSMNEFIKSDSLYAKVIYSDLFFLF
jgi:GINS complex subunit 2